MAPSAKAIEQALVDGTCAVYRAEPDATSVNKVRKHVSDDLDLDEEFFTEAKWKNKSKTIIKDTVEKLIDGWDPEAKPEKKNKNGVKKRQSSDEEEEPQPKRRKNAKIAKQVKKEVSDESDEEVKPETKAQIARRSARPVAGSGSEKDDEDEEDSKDIKGSESPERKRKRKIESDEDEDVAKHESDDEKDQKAASGSDQDADGKTGLKSEDSKPEIQEEDEYSDVIDEVPAPKRKKGVKKEKAVKKEPKTSKRAASADHKPADLDPNEAEIKKLQGQLVKCGVRKLWHNELKKYGSDAKAKIRHLRGMLADIGMDGRFSEQKAKEIKELRELQAEVEAATEMNELWGTEGRAGRGVRRGKSKSMKLDESDSEEDVKAEGEDEEEEDEGESFAARRRRAQADLAFLGDDSDSD